jgi:NAD(P)-dependent dehydrogenase (short-subunit alcohol dehydrogenase family)
MLQDRAIIVTGGGGGIGRAAAIAFAAAGAKVAIVDLNVSGATETAVSIEAAGGRCCVIGADVSREQDVKRMVAEVQWRFGRLDGAFNNAGVEQDFVALHETSIEQWRRVMSVDLEGVFLCMKYEIELMLANGGGAIVNTASALGQVATPNAAGYIAAKHGVIGITRAAAVEYAKRGIRVNAVMPGVIATPIMQRLAADPAAAALAESLRSLHPLGRFGEPNEVAQAALWLLSDHASFVTGTAVAVDGGYLAC